MSTIVVSEATEIVKSYYTDYARYVLETRALPSIYDGLKHVQRRLIYTSNKQPKKLTKSSNLVGLTMLLHPHGSDGVYGSLVSMTSNSSNLRLFKGKGNFGGYGFGSAAMRYTEAYLDEHARFGYTQFIDYAEFEEGPAGHQEPIALPALIPYSHIVGSSGIGVGLSTNIIPLNLMELIDYFVAVIKGETPKAPTPDFGNVIIDMDDSEIDTSVEGINSKVIVRSVVTQEDQNTFVVNSLFNKSVNSVVNKLRDLIDTNKVDFRDESSGSMRLVFEINDKSVTADELRTRLNRITSGSMTFTRLVVDGDKAVYCSLRHQVDKTLEYLNRVLDTKFKRELEDLKRKESVLLAINYIRSSSLINRLGKIQTSDIIDELVKNGFDEEIANQAVRRSISYLTKSHDDELVSIRNSIKELSVIDRTTYLIELYDKFREMVSPIYESSLHSIRRSKVLTTPRLKLLSNNNIEVSNSGVKFKEGAVLVLKDGRVSPKVISSLLSTTIKYDNLGSDLAGFITDEFKYGVLITNKNGVVAIYRDKITYDKKVVTLSEGEYINKVIGTNSEEFKYKGVDYNISSFLRVKVSKPVMNWIL